LLEFFDCAWVSRMGVHIDHAWPTRASLQGRRPEENFGRCEILFQ
jgi:hypothetical protein